LERNITDEFVKFLISIAETDLPVAVQQLARTRLLDYIGVTAAGAFILQEKGKKLLDSYGLHDGKSTAIGFDITTSIHNAALINGMSAHVAELDDGHRFGMVHPGAPVISALLSVAEVRELRIGDLLKGIVVGYEAAVRVARAVQPGAKERGYHATGTCGTVGAAAGVAAALGLSNVEMKASISTAAASASGLLNVIRGNSELKPYNAGMAAMNAITAVQVASSGIAPADNVFGGDDGFLAMMSPVPDAAQLLSGISGGYAIEQIYVKPYAACRHCHAPIEAALKIRSQKGFRLVDVTEIRVKTHRLAVYRHDHTEINGINSAKMSIPFCVALALVTGKAGLTEFSMENVSEKKIASLTRLVSVHADEEMTARLPAVRPAEVEVRTSDGATYRKRVSLPKGEPENPVTDEELKDKVRSLLAYAGVSPTTSESIIRTVLLEDFSLNKLFSLL
jgi:2-methylcitrate dehydratase PrpD